MKMIHRAILPVLTVFVAAARAYGTPPSSPNPYIVKSYRVSPAPEIDKWSTVELIVKCVGEPEPSLRMLVKASGIELDLPVPADIPDPELISMKHGVPYPIAMRGINGQLPTWEKMSKGSERSYRFRIRPYWYGKLGIDILNVGFIYYIGIGEDGKSTFAGTGKELETAIGKPNTPYQGDPQTLVYSDEQCEKQNRLLAKRKPGVHLAKTEAEYVLSGLGQGSILRQEYHVPRGLRKGETCKVGVRILSRSREDEMPSFVPTGAADCPTAVFKGNTVAFGKAQDGHRTGTIEITATEDDLQSVLFRVVYPWTKEDDIDQMPVYGIRLHFTSDKELNSVQ